MVTESDDFIQTKFIKLCLEIWTVIHKRGASTLLLWYPAGRLCYTINNWIMQVGEKCMVYLKV